MAAHAGNEFDPLLIFLFVRWGNILKDPILALGMILSFLSLSA